MSDLCPILSSCFSNELPSWTFLALRSISLSLCDSKGLKIILILFYRCVDPFHEVKSKREKKKEVRM